MYVQGQGVDGVWYGVLGVLKDDYLVATISRSNSRSKSWHIVYGILDKVFLREVVHLTWHIVETDKGWWVADVLLSHIHDLVCDVLRLHSFSRHPYLNHLHSALGRSIVSQVKGGWHIYILRIGCIVLCVLCLIYLDVQCLGNVTRE